VPKTSNKSEISKRSCEIPTLQDGGPFRDKEPAPKRGLSTQDRPKKEIAQELISASRNFYYDTFVFHVYTFLRQKTLLFVVYYYVSWYS
jgi:hypothetical protein